MSIISFLEQIATTSLIDVLVQIGFLTLKQPISGFARFRLEPDLLPSFDQQCSRTSIQCLSTDGLWWIQPNDQATTGYHKLKRCLKFAAEEKAHGGIPKFRSTSFLTQSRQVDIVNTVYAMVGSMQTEEPGIDLANCRRSRSCSRQH